MLLIMLVLEPKMTSFEGNSKNVEIYNFSLFIKHVRNDGKQCATLRKLFLGFCGLWGTFEEKICIFTLVRRIVGGLNSLEPKTRVSILSTKKVPFLKTSLISKMSNFSINCFSNQKIWHDGFSKSKGLGDKSLGD